MQAIHFRSTRLAFAAAASLLWALVEWRQLHAADDLLLEMVRGLRVK